MHAIIVQHQQPLSESRAYRSPWRLGGRLDCGIRTIHGIRAVREVQAIRGTLVGTAVTASDEFSHQVTKREFQTATANINIRIDDGYRLPLTRHRINITAHTQIGTKQAAEADIGIATVCRSVHIWTHCRSYLQLAAIIVAKGME